MIIGVIGAGASGLISAITASENIRNDILIFERQARVGKKLQVTGNGRCNLSNYNLSEKNYHGNDPSFSSYALKNFRPLTQ